MGITPEQMAAMEQLAAQVDAAMRPYIAAMAAIERAVRDTLAKWAPFINTAPDIRRLLYPPQPHNRSHRQRRHNSYRRRH